MRKSFATLFATVLAFGASAKAFAQPAGVYDGTFGEAQDSGSACATVFSGDGYHVTHFLAGANRQVSLMHFSGTQGTFFDGVTLTGNIGPDGDISYKKSVSRDGTDFVVVANGIVSDDVVYLEFSVKAVDAQGAEICKAGADYTGFN